MTSKNNANLDETSEKPAGAENALKGIRVVDFSAFMAGPYCGRWLADLGADVIKVEPLGGEHQRLEPPLVDGQSRYFGQMNAGKRSIALNLKNPEAAEIAHDLCMQSDVLIENFRPGVMKRLGLGAEKLTADNSKLIYCSVSGFGQNTSLSHMAAYAAIVQARSGFDMANLRYQGTGGKPANQGIHIADLLTAMFATISIQTALINRATTGQGTTIDVTLMDSIMNVLVYETQNAQFPQASLPRLAKPLKTKDSYILVSPTNENNFKAICDRTGRTDWLEDPRFNTFTERYKNWDDFQKSIELWTQQYSSEECEKMLSDAGVPCSRYFTTEEAMNDPQYEERSSYSTVSDSAGSFKVPNLPFMFDHVKPKAGAWVPDVGANTADILKEILGIDLETVERLAKEGALRK